MQLRYQEDIGWGVQQTRENVGFKQRICVVDADLGERLKGGEREGVVPRSRPWRWPSLGSEWKKALGSDPGLLRATGGKESFKKEMRNQAPTYPFPDSKQKANVSGIIKNIYIHKMVH